VAGRGRSRVFQKAETLKSEGLAAGPACGGKSEGPKSETRVALGVSSAVGRGWWRVGSAISLGRECGIRIELQKPTFPTAEGSDRHTFKQGCLCPRPKRLLRLAFVPAPDESHAVGIVRHEPLNHLTVAFWTLQIVCCHGRAVYPGPNREPLYLPVAFGTPAVSRALRSATPSAEPRAGVAARGYLAELSVRWRRGAFGAWPGIRASEHTEKLKT
jgi:hypothetical protein